ncbi:MAG: uroporphyrinogen-III synthase [Rubrivivax sp.]|nr:uroporphyrinogen-III synthase [Rubrivivax sp.]
MRVIVTRPAAQAAAWVADLRRDGFDAVALPLIEITPPADLRPVQQAWHTLARHRLLFFVSANAVLHFFAQRPPGAVWPASTRAAAPGPGTAAALRAEGLPPAAVLEPADDAASFDSESLWARLQAEPWAGCSVLVVRGENGRDWLAEQLRAAGAEVHFLAAYTRGAPQPAPAGQALLAAAQADPARHLWLLSSSEAVQHLQALWGGAVPPGARALASHPRIAQTARAAGFTEVQLCAPDPAAVRQALRLAGGGSIQSGPP